MSGTGPQQPSWGPPPGEAAPGGWGAPPSGGQPPGANWGPPGSTPGGWGPPGTPVDGGAGQVAVPSWLSSDWLLAAQIALVGQVMLWVLGVTVTIVGVLQGIAQVGFDGLDWAAVAVRPMVELLGWNGAGAGEPLLITGVLYSFLVYRVVARRHRAVLVHMAADRSRLAAAGVKVGLVAAGLLLVIAILLNSFAESLVVRAPSIAMTSSIDFTALVFFAIFVGAVTGLLALLSAANLSLVRFLGITASGSMLVRGGSAGARRTLLVGGTSLLILATVGRLLDSFSASGGLGNILGVLLRTIQDLAVRWLDEALLLLLGAAKFLHDGGYRWHDGFSTPAWMWVALPVLATAFVAGGVAAAKLAQPRSQAEAVKASILVGPFGALVSLLVAIGWAGQPFIEDIVPIAILLPSLWGILALGGAWVWANQQGLPSGFVVAGQPPSGGPPTAGGWAPPAGYGTPPTAQEPPRDAAGTWAPPAGATPQPQQQPWHQDQPQPEQRMATPPPTEDPAQARPPAGSSGEPPSQPERPGPAQGWTAPQPEQPPTSPYQPSPPDQAAASQPAESGAGWGPPVPPANPEAGSAPMDTWGPPSTAEPKLDQESPVSEEGSEPPVDLGSLPPPSGAPKDQ